MKKLLGLILALIIFMPLTVRADEWVLLDQNKDVSLFIKPVAKGSGVAVYSVWLKWQYDKEYARGLVIQHKAHKEGYKDYAYSLTQYEFDTAGRRLRLIRVVDCDANGRVIFSFDEASAWTNPVGFEEQIYEAVTAYISKAPWPPVLTPRTVALTVPGFEGYLIGDTFLNLKNWLRDNVNAGKDPYISFIEESGGLQEYMYADSKGVISFFFRGNRLILIKRHYLKADINSYRQKLAALQQLYGKAAEEYKSSYLWEQDGISVAISAYEENYFYVSAAGNGA